VGELAKRMLVVVNVMSNERENDSVKNDNW
jgi:hypothetical protein